MGGHLGFRWKHGTAVPRRNVKSSPMVRERKREVVACRRGERDVQRQTETRTLKSGRERERGEKGAAEREISAATTTYGSVAGTLDERSRSIELPGSPSLCLADSISLAFHSAYYRFTLAESCPPALSRPASFTRSSATGREPSEATDERGRSDKCRWRSMGPVRSWCACQ